MVLSRPLRLAAILVVVAGIGLSACGDDDDATVTPSTTTVPGVTTTAAGGTTPTTTTGPTTTAAAGRVLEYSFSGGKVDGAGRASVKLGEVVTVRVVSDVAEEVHIHTYDRMVELEPGVPGQVTFTADIPGVHEVELEDAGIHLFSLEVQ
ncbi:MAG: hypothetical protein QOE93_2255 [Actinomycetota bacterium]|jgi:hypothetical protein|nr:hypothetical protein [Actinomycetota bacterium]